MNTVLRWLTMVLAGVATVCTVGLLASDLKISIPWGLPAPANSATPLLLTGLSFLLVQALLRPRFAELLKNLLLAAAFLLWGLVQLMEQNDLSRRLGDVVIALYVIDLVWVMLASLNPLVAMRGSAPQADPFKK